MTACKNITNCSKVCATFRGGDVTNVHRVKGCSDLAGSANEGTLSWRRLERGL